MSLIASPLKLSETPMVETVAPPLLGELGDEILAGLLGLDSAAIAALRASGAVG